MLFRSESDRLGRKACAVNIKKKKAESERLEQGAGLSDRFGIQDKLCGGSQWGAGDDPPRETRPGRVLADDPVASVRCV